MFTAIDGAVHEYLAGVIDIQRSFEEPPRQGRDEIVKVDDPAAAIEQRPLGEENIIDDECRANHLSPIVDCSRAVQAEAGLSHQLPSAVLPEESMIIIRSADNLAQVVNGGGSRVP